MRFRVRLTVTLIATHSLCIGMNGSTTLPFIQSNGCIEIV